MDKLTFYTRHLFHLVKLEAQYTLFRASKETREVLGLWRELTGRSDAQDTESALRAFLLARDLVHHARDLLGEDSYIMLYSSLATELAVNHDLSPARKEELHQILGLIDLASAMRAAYMN